MGQLETFLAETGQDDEDEDEETGGVYGFINNYFLDVTRPGSNHSKVKIRILFDHGTR